MLMDSNDERVFTLTERLGFLLQRVTAYDPETGAELLCSHGWRMAWRPSRFQVLLPSGRFFAARYTATVRPDTNPSGEVLVEVNEPIFGLTAASTAEAIATANTRLRRWLADRPVFDPATSSWIRPDTAGYAAVCHQIAAARAAAEAINRARIAEPIWPPRDGHKIVPVAPPVATDGRTLPPQSERR
jgi:hypothetical protein